MIPHFDVVGSVVVNVGVQLLCLMLILVPLDMYLKAGLLHYIINLSLF